MKSTRTPASVLTVTACAAALTLAACGGGGGSNSPLATSSSTGNAAGGGSGSASGGGGGQGIVVGSANFPESQLIGAIYAGALKAQGVKVSQKPNIGSREIYLAALKDGSIDLVPEYTGALALYYDQNAKIDNSQAVYNRLKKLIPARLEILNRSAAEDKDSISVTAATAKKLHLKTIADLKGKARNLTLGAPPEFKQRPQGIPGLQKDYGVVFGSFRPLTGAALSNALKNGQIDAANIFTTDPSIVVDHFVVLKDPKGLFGVQNVVPLIVKSDVTPTVKNALNAVSAKLDTRTLTKLNKQVQVDHQDVNAVAQQFLKANGLDKPS
ncbi:MAG TPA: ABC transporter substrate-binding protein [Segeticoccus sp.]|uniref:ABC transporter substrate-binding protein n=1 Tax=Segeticoccus sp. TaxID=2706531 RepID=UPI002D80BCF4|nr:ABC transporter substrate-binding protein [Segeticoccus sp.]HET8602131.1 ABC transporter substrate-binding protein [Segeticoccus sp.]